MITKKLLALLFKLTIGAGIILSSFVSGWSATTEGTLPSKTGVVLHAINNQLVSPNESFTVPSFITRLNGSSSGGSRSFEREDLSIPMSDGQIIPGRMYKPSNAKDAPVIVYYHGGAFMEGYGNINTHDNIVRTLSSRANAIVISVGYRLAPSYVFPTATDDAYDALTWVHENANSFGGSQEKIIVAGDSAGGNIATVTAMKARDEGGPDLQAQLLYYPITTFYDRPLETRTKYDSGHYLLSRAVMEKARDSYTPGEEMWENPYVSPLDAEDVADLPPAFIATAEYDPLRDEGELYAHKLYDENIPVEAIRYEGVMHGFISLHEIMNTGSHAINDSLSFLDRTLAGEEERIAGFRIIERSQPTGWERLKEETEAHLAAIYLIALHVERSMDNMTMTVRESIASTEEALVLQNER